MCVFTPGSSSMFLSMTEESFTLSNSGLTHVSAIPLNADCLFTVFTFLKLLLGTASGGKRTGVHIL